MNLAAVSDVDGLAMVMVVILTLSFGMVALLVLSIIRHAKRRDREVEALLDEVRRDAETERSSVRSAKAPPTDPREPWEKGGDWWKS